MARYILKKQRDEDNEYDISDVEIVCDTVCLDEIVEVLQDFLKASGFVFDELAVINKGDE